MTYLHLAYLQQVGQLLGDQHKPLAARLGFIAKKISQKHVVHVNGADLPKLFLCKACQAPVEPKNVQTKRKKLILKCSLCGFKRSFSNGARLCPRKDARQSRRIDDDGVKDNKDRQQQHPKKVT